MNNQAVYTAIADGSELRDHPPVTNVDWVAFVTRPQGYEGSNWDVRPLFSYGNTDPHRQVAWYKVQSLLEMAEYERTMWIDQLGDVLPLHYIDHETPFGVCRHDKRDCVYTEANYLLNHEQTEPIFEQVDYYHDVFEYPEHAGLWDTSLIIRNRCPDTERIERQWWNEIDRWSYFDQLSLPVVLHNLSFHPEDL